MSRALAAALSVVAVVACGSDRPSTPPPAPAIAAHAPPDAPPDAGAPSLYDAYVAHARALIASGAAGASPIPGPSEIAIREVGALAGVRLYFADGGHFDDTPRRVFPSLVLADVDGRLLEARLAVTWRATDPIRFLACTERFVPGYDDLQRHAMTEDALDALERTECVDLTPRVAALFPPDLDAGAIDARLAVLFLLRDGQPGLDIVRDARALAGEPLRWTQQPHPAISPPSLVRTADAVEVRAVVMTESHVLAVTLRVAHGRIDLRTDAIAVIERRIPG